MAAQPTTDDLSHFDGFIRQFISYDINKFVLPIDRTVFLSDDLDDFLQTAIKNEASDIFVKTGTPIWARIYGRKYNLSERPLTRPEVESFIERLYDNSSTAIAALSAGKPIDKSYTLSRQDMRARFRVNISTGYSQGGRGYSITMRNTPLRPRPLDLSEIGEDLLGCFRYPYGGIFFCGATGTGKSQTLSGFIDYLARDPETSKKIITLEKPVEIPFDSTPQFQTIIDQFEIGTGGVTSFAQGIENAMRQAPNDIFVGEVRDMESMEAALHGMMSGHLIYTTLHANNVSAFFKRITGLGYEGIAQRSIILELINYTRLIYSQRLIPTLDGKLCVVREYLVFNEEITDRLLKDPDRVSETTAELVWTHGVHFAVHARQRVLEGKIASKYVPILSSGRTFTDEELDNRIRQLKAAGNPAFQNNNL